MAFFISSRRRGAPARMRHCRDGVRSYGGTSRIAAPSFRESAGCAATQTGRRAPAGWAGASLPSGPLFNRGLKSVCRTIQGLWSRACMIWQYTDGGIILPAPSSPRLQVHGAAGQGAGAFRIVCPARPSQACVAPLAGPPAGHLPCKRPIRLAECQTACPAAHPLAQAHWKL